MAMKGMAGVLFVTVALCGSIMCGYFLSGETATEEYDDYTLVTDIGGIYSYSTTPAYSIYSPYQNIYGYSSSQSDLGTYTTGISYTSSSSANVYPVITASSGVVTTTGTLTMDELGTFAYGRSTTAASEIASGTFSTPSDESLYSSLEYAGYGYVSVETKVVSVANLIDAITADSNVSDWTFVTISGAEVSGTFNTLVGYVAHYKTSLSDMSVTYNQSTTMVTFNNVNVITPSSSAYAGTGYYPYTGYNSTYYDYNLYPASVSDVTIADLTFSPGFTSIPTLSYIRINNDYSIEYQIEGGAVTTIPSSVIESYYIGITDSFDYSLTYYTNVDYIDPNYGVSPAGTTTYWSNGYDNGAVSWLFAKPSSDSSYTFASDNNTWSVTYTSTAGWTVGRAGLDDIALGTAWNALQITESYDGVLTIGLISSFTNFNSYRVASTTSYELSSNGSVSEGNGGTANTPLTNFNNLSNGIGRLPIGDNTTYDTATTIYVYGGLWLYESDEWQFSLRSLSAHPQFHNTWFFIQSISGMTQYSTGSVTPTYSTDSDGNISWGTITGSFGVVATHTTTDSDGNTTSTDYFYRFVLGDDPTRSFSPLTQYTITTSGTSNAMRMQVVQTQVLTGTLTGVMTNATLSLAEYFPSMSQCRISYDSMATVGTSISIGDWTMTTSRATMQGTMPDGTLVDLTKPISFIWYYDGTVHMTYYAVNSSYERNVTILDTDPGKVITLNGTWAVDTDLYSLSLGSREVFHANLGTWGLERDYFLILTVGLTVLFVIIGRVLGWDLTAWDMVIVLGFDAIMLWMMGAS